RGRLLAEEADVVAAWIDRNAGPVAARSVVLPWGTPDADRTHRSRVAPDSPAGELQRIAADLETFYGWQAAQAAAFVLCDVVAILYPWRATPRFRSVPGASRII